MKTVNPAIFLLLLPLQCWAMDSDRDQPINIEADRLEIHEQDNVSIYEGNVQLIQGSLRINSDRLVIHFNETNELELMEMTGKPAKFEQLNNEGEKIRGEAEQIDYNDLESLLILRRIASLDQAGKIINSDLIRYNTQTSKLEAGGQSETRTTILIPPRSKVETEVEQAVSDAAEDAPTEAAQEDASTSND